MSLCPAPLHPADIQAGSLGSAAQSVLVSGRLESLGEGQALAIGVSGVWVGVVAALELREAPLSSSTEEIVYKTNLSPPVRDAFLPPLLMANRALWWGPGSWGPPQGGCPHQGGRWMSGWSQPPSLPPSLIPLSRL